MTGPADADAPALLAGLALARGTLDRAAHRRGDQAWLDDVRRDPDTRVLLLADGQAPVQGDGPGTRLLLLAADDVATAQAEHAGEPLFLGVDGADRAYLAVSLPAAAAPPADAAWAGLREVGALLDDRDAGLLVTAVALQAWHDRHGHCARCGSATVVGDGGWVRRCPQDGSEHYPRTDPAVIVLVRDEQDRALLGRQGRWPAGWFSTLAGFVEPGESAEAAVRREVLEEAGVRVDEVTYLGSQPWPFPSSLMLGYHARTGDTALRVDGEEIAEAAWFTRADLAAACAAGRVRVPPRVSIARRLIERWYGAELPGSWSRPPVPGR